MKHNQTIWGKINVHVVFAVTFLPLGYFSIKGACHHKNLGTASFMVFVDTSI